MPICSLAHALIPMSNEGALPVNLLSNSLMFDPRPTKEFLLQIESRGHFPLAIGPGQNRLVVTKVGILNKGDACISNEHPSLNSCLLTRQSSHCRERILQL